MKKSDSNIIGILNTKGFDGRAVVWEARKNGKCVINRRSSRIVVALNDDETLSIKF